MKENLIISIIVPVYNQEEYLNKSILSAINQSYKNIEIIIINDGSTDKSVKILEKFANIDDRIKIIHQKNQGLVGATLTGIKNSTGDYICFLDPDDFIGENFVSNFVQALDKDYDFVAAGYYIDNGVSVKSKELDTYKVYNNDELVERKNSFLSKINTSLISDEFFISRWNKIYKKECVNKILNEFETCKNVSLGEDTIFTFLVICNSTLGKTIKKSNEYFYNVANQNSMMKNSNIEAYVDKCNIAFNSFSKLLNNYNCELRQAYLLFYFLIDTIFVRVNKNDSESFEYLYNFLMKNDIYLEAIKVVLKQKNGIKNRIDLILRILIRKSKKYLMIKKAFKKFKLAINNTLQYIIDIKRNLCIKNLSQIKNKLKFSKQRRNAFIDIKDKLPLIERRITPYLKSYETIITDLNESKIEKNIFVFWWDGFDNAPDIVKECKKSVYKYYKDYKIIPIDKDNYKKYTNINLKIINDFENGKISIQTFSDILRFNLLKHNGGMWIDATIFFLNKCDLFEKLKTQSFNTLTFCSSEEFLQYKGEVCSWSGYFIASRKGSVLVDAIDNIFEKYYLEYNEYTTYFFIDAVLMICKINKIDNDVLSKSYYVDGDMFLLGEMLDKTFDKFEFEKISKIPQKLTWFYETKSIPDSYYENIVKG